MTMIAPSDQTSRGRLHWPAIFQLAFSVFGVFLLFAGAGIFIITGLSTYLTQGRNPSDLTEPFMVAGSLAFAGALIIPSAWYAWKQIANPGYQPAVRPEPRNYGLMLTIIVFVATGLALLAGNWVAQNDQIAWLLLPPLNVIVTGLPALWLIYFGTRGLLPNSPRHKWGVFASGLVLGPVIILVAELILLVVLAFLAVGWVMAQDPTLANQLTGLMTRLQSSGTDTQAMLNSLLPFLLNPGVLFIALSFISVLVPIIEETIKPVGVWFMAGNKLTPAMGFAFGVLSGAGFGLFENLGNTSGAGTDWALLAGSRISTLLLHSFTAGLVGWGLASAWSERKFIRLAFSFTVAVLIHGLWNGMAVLSAGAALQNEPSLHLPAGLQPLAAFATLGIFTLGVLVVFGFFGFNAYLRRSLRPAPITSTGGSGSLNPPAVRNEPAFVEGLGAPDAGFPNTSSAENLEESPQEKIDPQHPITGENPSSKVDFAP